MHMKSLPVLSFPPEQLAKLQADYAHEMQQLWQQGLQTNPVLKDRRFAGEAWQHNPVAAFNAAMYLLNARTLLSMSDMVDTDEKTRARIRFSIEQWVAAAAPSNFLAFNADAQQKAIDTKGESIMQGVQNMLHDMRQGHVSMTDESKFEVGKNVAGSEGAVVFENEIFQLIEYKPLTPKVFQRPFLLVPPCINKFYILDLQPANSFIRHVVAQGHRTFVVSWRNPDASMNHATWDDYVEKGVIQAIEVARSIGNMPQINALGFCVGGTLLTSALAVLAARGQDPVASATLLTTLVDFKDVGVLDVFIDEPFVQYREAQFSQGGLMAGRDMASTFSFLRPNDLVWNYVVENYLKGNSPAPFDLLYWNGDSTNLPGAMYCWYLRHTYLQNDLVKPGKLTICNEKVDLGKIKCPAFIYASQEDHIVPWQSAYESTHILRGKNRFVLGASGHIAGVINPPAKNKRYYFENNQIAATAQEWLEEAKQITGSWWPSYTKWLDQFGGEQKPASNMYGNGKYKKMEAAPGVYVKEKSSPENH